MTFTGLKNKVSAFLDRTARKVEHPLWIARNCVLLLVLLAVGGTAALIIGGLLLHVGWVVFDWAFREIPIVAWTVVGLTVGELFYRWSKRRVRKLEGNAEEDDD